MTREQIQKKGEIIARARKLGASFDEVRVRTISFMDLARTEKQFIYFGGLRWTNGNNYRELKKFVSRKGFVLTEQSFR